MTARRLARLARIVAAVAALSLAAAGATLLDEPIAFPHRAALALAAVAAGAAFATAVRRAWATLLAAALAASTAWTWAAPWRDARAVWADLPAARAAGRHLVVGYGSVDEVRAPSRAGLIGGVFLTRRNVAGRSVEAVAAEVAGLQADRRAAGLPPLVVAADQEGGPVSHLSPPLAPVPALSLLADLPAGERREGARREGEAAGAALARLGVTMDLGPVADLRPAAARAALDLHTRIATRAVSDDPAAAAEVAAGFAQGLAEAGVRPTAKHFPGLGSVAADTHLFGAALPIPRAALEAADWRPFRAVLAVPGAALMVSHASSEALDPGVPASRSRAIVEGLVRGDWGFDGIVVTDDLGMGAAVHPGLCRSVEGALAAGIDLLLVSWDTDRVYPALRCAAMAARAGRLDPATLVRSAARLDRAIPPPAQN